MAIERTLAIIKPDAVAAGHSGEIIRLIELNGFTIVGMRKAHLKPSEVEQFYAVHKERSFFGEMVQKMSSSSVILMALERDNAIVAWRDLMGATNPASAALGTIRRMFGTSIGNNATHGSDAPETARVELEFFFPDITQ